MLGCIIATLAFAVKDINAPQEYTSKVTPMNDSELAESHRWHITHNECQHQFNKF